MFDELLLFFTITFFMMIFVTAALWFADRNGIEKYCKCYKCNCVVCKCSKKEE